MLLAPEFVPAMVGTFVSRQAQRIAICLISKQIDQFSKKKEKKQADRSNRPGVGGGKAHDYEALAPGAEPAGRHSPRQPNENESLRNQDPSISFIFIHI